MCQNKGRPINRWAASPSASGPKGRTRDRATVLDGGARARAAAQALLTSPSLRSSWPASTYWQPGWSWGLLEGLPMWHPGAALCNASTRGRQYVSLTTLAACSRRPNMDAFVRGPARAVSGSLPFASGRPCIFGPYGAAYSSRRGRVPRDEGKGRDGADALRFKRYGLHFE